jgi:hypothetical protein
MTPCPKCEAGARGRLVVFKSETWGLMQNIGPGVVGSIWTSARRMLDGYEESWILQCDNSKCKAYGYLCPSCGRVETMMNRPGDGVYKVCDGCKEQYVVRHYLHFLNWRKEDE